MILWSILSEYVKEYKLRLHLWSISGYWSLNQPIIKYFMIILVNVKNKENKFFIYIMPNYRFLWKLKTTIERNQCSITRISKDDIFYYIAPYRVSFTDNLFHPSTVPFLRAYLFNSSLDSFRPCILTAFTMSATWRRA